MTIPNDELGAGPSVQDEVAKNAAREEAARKVTDQIDADRKQEERKDAARKPINDKRKQTAMKAFQAMWIAGTAGAFFTALARNVPSHFLETSFSPDWLYTLDRFLRYGYLFWLLAYFFTSNLRVSDPAYVPDKKDLAFDVLQSACALVAAFALGFIVTGSGFAVDSYGWAMGFANGTILVISGFSLIWWPDPPTEIRRHRIIGIVVSLLGIIIAVAKLPRLPSLLLFSALHIILCVTLYSYICKRLTLQVSEEKSNSEYLRIRADGL